MNLFQFKYENLPIDIAQRKIFVIQKRIHSQHLEYRAEVALFLLHFHSKLKLTVKINYRNFDKHDGFSKPFRNPNAQRIEQVIVEGLIQF